MSDVNVKTECDNCGKQVYLVETESCEICGATLCPSCICEYCLNDEDWEPED